MNDLAKVAAEEATKTAGGIMTRLFGPLADGLGMLISHGTRMRVLENQIRGMKKVNEICERENVSTKVVSLKVVLPYLEGVGLEEEPLLEQMWANLMTNYLDAEKNLETVVYPSILKQLSTREVEVLGMIYQMKNPFISIDGRLPVAFKRDSPEPEEIDYPLNNLLRLGLLEKVVLQSTSNSHASAGLGMLMPATSVFQFSGFGKEFYNACQRAKK